MSTTSTAQSARLETYSASVEVPKFNHLRQDANPILAAHMLQEIYKMVTDWQAELEEIEFQSQQVLDSGPVVAGWLESRTQQAGDRGEDVPAPYQTIDALSLTDVDPDAGYRLCGLNEFGELWTRSCVMSEILKIGQSIARYQQLKDLTDRKQYVEQHIRQILEDLVHLRMKLVD
jgi:hypothetical protein